MKKILSSAILVLMLIILIPDDVFAEAKAVRRNRCTGIWDRYKVKTVVNGPGIGECSRSVQNRNGCTETSWGNVSHQRRYVGAKCNRCYQQFEPNVNKTAIDAYAESNSSKLHSFAKRYTSCKRYRAGSNVSNLIQYTNEEESLEDILNTAEIMADEEIYDYTNNSINLSNFKGSLYIESLDYINEYAIFNFEIVSLSTDEITSDTIRTVLKFAQAKIINGQFIVIGDQSVFNVNDFDFMDNGANGISASFEFLNKLILFDSNITENMDIEISMTADVGNLEDVESEVDMSPVSLNVAYNMVSHNAEIDILTDIQRSGTLKIRNAFGNILFTQNNVVIEPSLINHFSISTNEFGIATFYVVEFQTDDGIFALGKFIKIN